MIGKLFKGPLLTNPIGSEILCVSTAYALVSIAAGAIPTITLLLWLSVVPLERRYVTAVAAFVTANVIAVTGEVMQRVGLQLRRNQEVVSAVSSTCQYLAHRLQGRHRIRQPHHLDSCQMELTRAFVSARSLSQVTEEVAAYVRMYKGPLLSSLLIMHTLTYHRNSRSLLQDNEF
jgi:hypothetical protein